MTTDRHAEIAAHRTGIIRDYLYRNDARYDDGWQTVTDIHRRIEADGWTWSAAVTRSLLNRMAEAGTIVREVRRGRARSGYPGIMNERQVRMYCLPTPAADPEPAAAPEPTPADSGDPVERARLFAAAYPDGTRYGGNDIVIGRSAETAEVLIRDDEGREWWRAADMPDTEEEADYIRGNLQMRAWSDDAYMSDVFTLLRATHSNEVSMLRAQHALLMAAWDDAIEEHIRRFMALPEGFEPYPPGNFGCDKRAGWRGSLWCKLTRGHGSDGTPCDPDPYVHAFAVLRDVEQQDAAGPPVRIDADLSALADRVDDIRARFHRHDVTLPQAVSELTGSLLGLTVLGARDILAMEAGEPLTAIA